ncbi:flagellar brake protein [Desulfonatronum thioautotrophicum]|uniref:flagellar brake protein n=1 Tax=Desulfonatronum thioautotrophicum TaxID=617001 RepID=UPI000B2391E7|nr:hypothetical protein [Desulfonatronum thioautotrophicum]
MFPVMFPALHLLPLGQTNLYFQSWELSWEQAQRPLTITITLITVLIVTAIGLHLYRKRTSQEGNWLAVSDPEKIQSVMDQALRERATLDTMFQGEWSQRAHFSCALLAVEPDRGIILETPGYTHPQPTWVNRTVTCHFRVASTRKDVKWLFYHFSAPIIDIQYHETRDAIVVQIPKQLLRGQRRAYLRLEPFTQDIPELRIWPETFTNLETDVTGPPLATFLNTRAVNPVHILNISAGGMLLEIRVPLHQLPDEVLEKGKRFYLHFLLRDPEDGGVKEFHLRAQIRNLFTDPHDGKRLAGFSFTAFRKAPEGIPDNWATLDGKGVEAIDDWVFKRHLQVYRQKGLT